MYYSNLRAYFMSNVIYGNNSDTTIYIDFEMLLLVSLNMKNS